MTRRLLLALVALLSLSLGACADKIPLQAKAAMQMEDGVHVELVNAYFQGDKIYVTAYLHNNGAETLRVDRDGWIVKLPTGENLDRSVGLTSGTDFIILGPNMGREVDVDFKADGYDLSGLTSVTLIVGGIMVGESSTPFVVGEMELVRGSAPRGTSAPAAAAAAAGSASEAAPSTTPAAAPGPASGESRTLVPEGG